MYVYMYIRFTAKHIAPILSLSKYRPNRQFLLGDILQQDVETIKVKILEV